MKVVLYQPWRGTLNGRRVDDVEIPALPAHGDHIGHDPSGVSGCVDLVMFWWPEDGGECVTEVRLAAVNKPEKD